MNATINLFINQSKSINQHNLAQSTISCILFQITLNLFSGKQNNIISVSMFVFFRWKLKLCCEYQLNALLNEQKQQVYLTIIFSHNVMQFDITFFQTSVYQSHFPEYVAYWTIG